MLYFPNDNGRILRLLKNSGFILARKTNKYILTTYTGGQKILETDKYSVLVCPEIGQIKISHNIFKVLKPVSVIEIELEKHELNNNNCLESIESEYFNFNIFEKDTISVFLGSVKYKDEVIGCFVGYDTENSDFLDDFFLFEQHNFVKIPYGVDIDCEMIELFNKVNV